MPTIERSFVKGLLQPHEPTIREIYLKAWDRWLRNAERAEYKYRRTRANIVHEYVMGDALIRWIDDRRIHPIEKHESALFLVEDSLLFRLKKGNERGLGSNVGTQTVLALFDPDEDLNLFDLPDVPRVDVLYQLNALETLVDDVLVVARDGDQVIWNYSIFADEESGKLQPTLPTSPPEPPKPDTGLRLPVADQRGDKEKKAE